MDDESRNVRAVGLFYAFIGFIFAAVGVLLLVSGSRDIGPGLSAVVLAYGTLLMVSGIMLRQFKAWAWWVCAILSGLGVVGSLLNMALTALLLYGVMFGALMKARCMFFEHRDSDRGVPGGDHSYGPQL